MLNLKCSLNYLVQQCKINLMQHKTDTTSMWKKKLWTLHEFSKFWQDNQKSCYCCGSEHLIYLLAFKCLAVCITDVNKNGISRINNAHFVFGFMISLSEFFFSVVYCWLVGFIFPYKKITLNHSYYIGIKNGKCMCKRRISWMKFHVWKTYFKGFLLFVELSLFVRHNI